MKTFCEVINQYLAALQSM